MAERQDDQDHYDKREVITAYFRKGHEYSRIVELLEREHNSNIEKPPKRIQFETSECKLR